MLVAYLAAVSVATLVSAVSGDPVLQAFATTPSEVAQRGVWIILRSGLVSGLSLAAGYAALPFGITVATLFGPKPPE